jgi:hypothetical protein
VKYRRKPREKKRVDKKDAKLKKNNQVNTLALQPVTDQFYEPGLQCLTKYSRWRDLARIVATCLRWKNKKRGILNPLEIWDAECAITALSQSQSYRATLVQLKFHVKVNHDKPLIAYEVKLNRWFISWTYMNDLVLGVKEDLRRCTIH